MSGAMSFARVRALAGPCCRYISHKAFQVTRSSRMLNKMLKKTPSKTPTENFTKRKLKHEFLLTAYDNEATNRKTAALNKFYMEHLLELINSGPFANELTELGIQFSKVKIASCRSSINIYWASNKDGIPEFKIAEVLHETKKDLQAQMGFMRSMGKVPFITFVRDIRLEKAQNVEKIFEIADFGKDHEVSNPKRAVKSDFDVMQEGSSEEENEELKITEKMFGLNHNKIEEKIKQNIRRFQAINIRQNEVQEVRPEEPGKLVVFSKQLFTKFYKRKMFLDKKLRSREYNETYFDLREPYDSEKEVQKHWEFLTGNLIESELEELHNNFAELCGDDADKFEGQDDNSEENKEEEMQHKAEKLNNNKNEV